MSAGNSTGAPYGPPRPLNMVIVGAGIGGLAAGLALRQAGHSVTLLDSSKFSREIGAGLHIAPYSNGALKRLGIDIQDNGEIGGTENTGTSIWPPFSPKNIWIPFNERNKWQHRRVLVHRAKLHTVLREKALAEDGAGKPCTLRLTSRVVSVDPEAGEVVLENGERVVGDVVLGADGIHSQCRKFLEGGKGFVPFQSGITAFRFTVPMQVLRDDPVTAPLLGEEGALVAALTPGGIKRLICYPINNNTLWNFVFTHDSTESETDDESPANLKKLILRVGSVFSPAFQAVLSKVEDDTIRRWPLMDLPALPTWVNGKMALLGDAAHPFLPHRAEGASQAIEDAMSLGTIFYFGTPPEAVPERLALYERCRKERASKIQDASRIFSQSMEYQKKKNFDPHAFDNYSFSHDEHHSSLQALRLLLKGKRPDIRMRMPISFGPAPGPCQPGNTIHGVLGSKPTDFTPQQTVYTIRFTSSATYLKNYFPTPAFSFAKPDTVVQASLVCTSFSDLAWLGGNGYERVGLCIHGAQYKQANGEVTKGAFVPVLFENSYDSLVIGREERGAPTVGCDIDVAESGDSKAVTLGWNGATIGQMRFEGVSTKPNPETAAPKSEDDGLLFFRFVPAVGKPGGKPDAAYAVFEPYEETEKSNGSSQPTVTNSTQHPSKASFEFTTSKWQAIPTLHHIVKNLQGIPIYDIVESKIEVVQGRLDDFTRVRRLD